MFVACGIRRLADVSSVSPSSEQTGAEGLTLETSAKHHIPQATNIPYQPLLIKPNNNLAKLRYDVEISKVGFSIACDLILKLKLFSL